MNVNDITEEIERVFLI